MPRNPRADTGATPAAQPRELPLTAGLARFLDTADTLKLTPRQLLVLVRIVEATAPRRDCSIPNLARSLQEDRGRLFADCCGLVDRGLARRTPDPATGHDLVWGTHEGDRAVRDIAGRLR